MDVIGIVNVDYRGREINPLTMAILLAVKTAGYEYAIISSELVFGLHDVRQPVDLHSDDDALASISLDLPMNDGLYDLTTPVPTRIT